MAVPTALLSKLYESVRDGLFSDFAIYVENATFNVHKFVLAKRSPFFHGLFGVLMKESHEQRLFLDDVEENVFRLFLEFVYTGEFANTKEFEDNASKLLFCGSKYQLADLVDKCDKFLRISVANLSLENAARCLVVSHLFDLADLYNDSISVASHDWDRVMRSTSWPDIVANHKLATSIGKFMMKKFVAMHDEEPGTVTSRTDHFKWLIKSPEFPKVSNGYVQSQAVTLTVDKYAKGFPWKLRLQKRKDDIYSFYLVFAGTGVMPPYLSCKLTVLISGHEREGVFDFGSDYRRVQILDLIPLDSEMPGTTTTLYCPFSSMELRLQIKSTSRAGPSSALEDFKEYVENRPFADGVILLRDEVFDVHKLLFSATCTVLEKRFATNDKIQFNNFEPNVFGSFAKFIYSGETEQSSGPDVLRAAYYFGLRDEQLDHLRAVLIKQFDFNNVLPILRLALTNQDKFLVENAFEFIFLHFSSMILQPSFEQMAEEPSLHGDFLRFVNDKLKSIVENTEGQFTN